MTDNQRIAIDELSQYREAKKDIALHQQQIEVIETKVNRATRACDSLMQQTWQDGKFVCVPVAVQAHSGRNAGEDLLDTLMDARRANLARQADAERLCMRLEVNISNRCKGVDARFLSAYFLYNQRLEQIAVRENFSFAHIKRIKWRALERYGEKMEKEEPR